MTSPLDPIQPLREALAASPDNVPLRRHLADTLRALGRFDEAEAEFKELLGRAPSDEVRLGLAATYLDAGKASHAAVLVELVTGREDAPSTA
ncbi:MAG: tetratricopeptide repeat protein, partial [Planctomycetota bacterium]